MNTQTNPADELDQDVFDSLDDFDSEEFDYAADGDNGYLTHMWGRTSFGTGRRDAADLIEVHGLVESFVNAFARDGRYTVTFDPAIETAATDLKTRKVTISPAPLLDTNISVEEAGLIMTGCAVHEIDHPRYQKNQIKAVDAAFGYSAAAHRVSNVLGDVSIERHHVRDYPGYAGVFTPTLNYIGRKSVEKLSGKKFQPSLKDPLNILVAAVRYPEFADWSDAAVAAERDWWQAWANRWWYEDAPKRHVEAVRIALKHIAEQAEQQPESGDAGQTGQTGQGGGQSGSQDSAQEGAQSSSAGAGDGSDDQPGSEAESAVQDAQSDDQSDTEIAAAADAASQGGDKPLPTCLDRSAIDAASGLDRSDIRQAATEAQEEIANQSYYEDDGQGGKVDVARSMKGLNRRDNYSWERESGTAARYIRDALLRSRSGHTDVSSYRKRGRLDSRGLDRIAQRDFRLFTKKTAPSPGKYNIWMMVDHSSSMSGGPASDANAVVRAIADAGQHVKTTRMSVWYWSDSFRNRWGASAGVARASAGVARVWKTGRPTAEIAKALRLEMGGTPDRAALGWAWRAIKAETKQGETPVIFFCSDGFGDDQLGEEVAAARKAGVQVYSVAVGNIDAATQEARYGKDGFIPWAGSVEQTARPLARLIAKMVGKADAR